LRQGLIPFPWSGPKLWIFLPPSFNSWTYRHTLLCITKLRTLFFVVFGTLHILGSCSTAEPQL
jgi:hypothetical protein